MAKLVSLNNRDGDIVYPKTITDAVYTNDGKTITEEIINLKIKDESLTEKTTKLETDVKNLDETLKTIPTDLSDYADLSELINGKANQSELNTHVNNTNIHITTAERTNWNSAKTHADSTHAPSDAQANQNAFSNVTVGTSTISADTPTDTLTLVAGSNITITPDITNDKITIASKDTVYTHPSYTAKSAGLYKVTVDATGHISAATAVTKSDITALGIPAQDTTYTLSALGLTATATELNTLDGITATVTELNYCDGVTSNIQTQLNAKSPTSHTHSKLVDTGSVGYRVELQSDGTLTIYDKNNTSIWNSKDVSVKKSDISNAIYFSNAVDTNINIG